MCSDKPCLSTTLMTTTAMTIKWMEILGGRDKGNSIVSCGDVRGWLRKMLNNSASNQLFSPCYVIAITSALVLLLVCDKILADDDSLFRKNVLSLVSGWSWGRNCSVISDMFNLVILKWCDMVTFFFFFFIRICHGSK